MPVANDHVGTLNVGSLKFFGRWGVGQSFFHPLIEGTVPPDAPLV